MTAPNLSPQFSRGWNAGNCASPNVRDKLDQITTSALHFTWSKGIDSALRTPTCSSQTARRNLKSCRCVRGTIKKEANNGSPNETAENWARNEANLKKEEIKRRRMSSESGLLSSPSLSCREREDMFDFCREKSDFPRIFPRHHQRSVYSLPRPHNPDLLHKNCRKFALSKHNVYSVCRLVSFTEKMEVRKLRVAEIISRLFQVVWP